MQTRKHIRSVSHLKCPAAQISEEVAAMVIEALPQYQEMQELIASLTPLA